MYTKIKVITKLSVANDVVRRILMLDPPIIGVSGKGVPFNNLETITLVTVVTLHGEVFIFDIRKNRDLMISGGVGRVLQSKELKKVLHDGNEFNLALRRQFGVRIQNVFDTQVAYSLIMQTQGLPPRFIHVRDAYVKYGGVKEDIDPATRQLMSEDPNFWSRRPLSKVAQRVAAMDTIPLLPTLYDALNREITADIRALFEHMSEDNVRPLSMRRQRTRTAEKAEADEMRRLRTDTKSPILKLNKSQEKMLQYTVPYCER
ncbi:piRNA biogenesis protein EXD1 [Lingula anatina]|uniref:PiRNA biogenesis protein EXD1 n=1 Tax=Lingula anatina TaxID=7574 RepID=A0A1S3KAY9_LINAN|nr:piRNA biogenesis protein EXD1 [Lingula anatina]XP_013419594.1 piRNA biogenesis protein EXD1 [Lingula anatina]|eukprot:XP_013419593.1 piRNA biogenesis protein EXD1 [Lingula anatina]